MKATRKWLSTEKMLTFYRRVYDYIMEQKAEAEGAARQTTTAERDETTKWVEPKEPPHLDICDSGYSGETGF